MESIRPMPSAQLAGSAVLGTKWDIHRLSSYTSYLSSISGSVTFYELVWCKVEPAKGIFDWHQADKFVDEAARLGERMMLKLRVGRCWATGGRAQYERGQGDKTESAMPLDLGAYRAFVEAAVRRYAPKGVVEYAVENEINSPSNWAGTPAQYRQLIGVAAQAIHAASPKAVVVGPGLSSTTYGYGIAARLVSLGQDDQAVQAYDAYFQRRFGTRSGQLPRVSDLAGLQAVLGSEQGRRDLQYLALVQQLARERVFAVRQIHFYEAWSSVPDLLTYLRATTPAATPIQAWEVGSFWEGSNASADERAAELVKTVSLLLAGGVHMVVWLPLAVNPNGRHADEPRYGLLDPDGAVRPSGQALAAIVAAARGAKVTPVAAHGLSGVAFERVGRTDLFVWSASSQPVHLRLSHGDQAAVVGQPTAGRPTGGSTLAVGSEPQQLTVSGGLTAFLAGQ